MDKEQKNSASDTGERQTKSMEFPLEAFLKKLKKEQREKTRGDDKE